ncbi:hypothetical protein DFP72DRAFT_865912 [Ephemerocybe angulata]|uniref:Uncharacterized protein n=1 Tax=Ephemerocybe angulata TaxID=980116 RepID=A0A8H6IL76_9AGAR|nr:hypothetical protein DFP72DRAFT_865912 [Tulosesus angulatus]
MNSVLSQRISQQDPSSSQMSLTDDLRHVLATAHAVLDQPPPPSLREILTAYRSKGDGDREMLLAMLNAKTAEDQRLSSVASLQRSLLELYQNTSEARSPSARSLNSPYPHGEYPASAPYPDQRLSPSSRKARSRSRSPSRMPGQPSSMPEPSRKRQRSSRSPHSSHNGAYEPSHPAEQFPPSPYSSSDRSDSAEYSPRSRASMAIGSLLSDGPRRDVNGDATH